MDPCARRRTSEDAGRPVIGRLMEAHDMCTTCGCGDLEKRHKATDIVREDLQRAADGQGMPIEETIRNLEASLQRLRSGSPQPAGASTEHR